MNADIDPITLVQLTDTHLYADPDAELLGVHTRRSLSRVLADVGQRFPEASAVLLTGDLVHDGSAAGYHALAQALSQLGIPCYFVPGNHDSPETMAAILNGGHLMDARSLILGKWKCILLDTFSLDEVGGRLHEVDMAFLAQQLKVDSDRHALIAMHHPPLAVGCEWLDRIALYNADDFFSVTADYKHIRAVVFGHVHQEFAATRGGLQMLGTPSTCTQFKPGQTEFALDEPLPGYRVFHLHTDGTFRTEVIRVRI